MNNDGKIPASDKGHFPRPSGGCEPSPLGDDRPFGSRNPALGGSSGNAVDPKASMGGCSDADIQRGYWQGGKITDAGSDGAEGA